MVFSFRSFILIGVFILDYERKFSHILEMDKNQILDAFNLQNRGPYWTGQTLHKESYYGFSVIQERFEGSDLDFPYFIPVLYNIGILHWVDHIISNNVLNLICPRWDRIGGMLDENEGMCPFEGIIIDSLVIDVFFIQHPLRWWDKGRIIDSHKMGEPGIQEIEYSTADLGQIALLPKQLVPDPNHPKWDSQISYLVGEFQYELINPGNPW